MKYVPYYSPKDLAAGHTVIELTRVIRHDCIQSGNPTAAYVYARMLAHYAMRHSFELGAE